MPNSTTTWTIKGSGQASLFFYNTIGTGYGGNGAGIYVLPNNFAPILPPIYTNKCNKQVIMYNNAQKEVFLCLSYSMTFGWQIAMLLDLAGTQWTSNYPGTSACMSFNYLTLMPDAVTSFP